MKKNSETISTLPFRVMTVSLATILNRLVVGLLNRMLFRQCDKGDNKHNGGAVICFVDLCSLCFLFWRAEK